MVNGLLDKVGFRWTLRIWAIGMAVVAGLALLGVKPRVPVPKYHRGQNRPRLIPVQMHFLRRPIFWTFVSFVPQYAFDCLIFVIPVYHNRPSSALLFPSVSVYRSLHQIDFIPPFCYYRSVVVQLFWGGWTNSHWTLE